MRNEDVRRKVAILLCTRNGARFIREQLDSFAAQDHGDWELWVSDDGSGDDTIDIVNAFSSSAERRVEVLSGPQRGFARNFLSLTRHEAIRSEYYAWSDQDDVWLPDKLSRAITRLEPYRHLPALYCARATIVGGKGEKTGASPLLTRPATFPLCLAQCPAGGSTMVFNRAARDLLGHGDIPDIYAHDWWLAILVSGCGGVILYDPAPAILYRQHESNVIGLNNGLAARLRRFASTWRGSLARRNAQHIAALSARKDLLDGGSRRRFELFARSHAADSICERMRLLRESGVRRIPATDRAALWLLTLAGKYP